MDNLIIFVKATHENVVKDWECLSKNKEWPGQMVNFKKSTIMSSKNAPPRNQKIKNQISRGYLVHALKN